MNINAHSHISSIILAAGLSIRMKQPKIILPWGNTTVIGRIIQEFQKGGVKEVVVVTGGYRDEVEAEAIKQGAQVIFNPLFENGEMIDSLKIGLSFIQQTNAVGSFIALGDQPGIDHIDIAAMCDLFRLTQSRLIIPSYNMRRGHPWLIDRALWPEIMNLKAPQTMRDFIESKKDQIQYYDVQRSNILDDLDTPEDYQRLHP